MDTLASVVRSSRSQAFTLQHLSVRREGRRTMSEDGFIEFLGTCRKKLRSISYATRGELSPEDVESEAWLMLATLQGKGHTVDLRQPEHRELLISHLYQHLVRYTEKKVRHAIRLDHAPGGEEGEMHPLAHLLAADEHYDPALALMHAQEQALEQAARRPLLGVHQSLASAYVHLLERFDNRMEALADHLLISLSYCYRRCAHARVLAVNQQPIPSAAMREDSGFVPGAWRSFRLHCHAAGGCLGQLSLQFEADDTTAEFGPGAQND